ncbi:MAG: PAS domain S-box protein [Bacteroidetes bacterium]|nr:PAS domain S-box protein [Bacteroidota bacterium]
MVGLRRNRTIIVISLVTIAAGTAVMLGWAFNIRGLQSIVPGLVPMVFNIAVCFVLFSIALLVTQYQHVKYQTVTFFILSLFATSIGALTVLQYVFHFNSGLDQLLVKDWRTGYTVLPYELSVNNGNALTNPFYPGRMSLNSAVCFLLLGAGFLLLTTKRRVSILVAQYIFHAINIFAATILIGYLYGVSLVHTLLYVASMTVQTAIFFIAISLAASLLNPSVGITGLFTGRLVGNQMIRRLFGLMILVVIVFGMLRIETSSYQLSLNAWVSIVSVCFLLACLLILWPTALWLNKIDLSRTAAEEKVSRINSALEEMIEDRTLAFQKSEAKYRLLIEHASDAIYVVDVKGAFTEVNDSMCRMTGYSRNELLTMNIEEIVDPGELKNDPVKHGPRNAEESIIRERRLLRKDGTIFNAEISVRMFPDGRALVIARDITDRKKMEAELTEAELKFRTLAEQSMMGIYIFQQGKFAYVNPRFAEIFGYEPHELIGTYPVDTIIHEDYRATVRENVRKRMEEEVPSIHYEVEGLKKDGSTNWIEFFGNRVLIGNEPTIIGTMLDITERKHAEESLQKSEANLQTILTTTDTAYALFDPELKVLAFNKMAIDFVRDQYKHTPKKGDQLPDFFPKERFPQFKSFAAEVLGGKNIHYEIDYPQADGSVRWYFVRLFPIASDNKEILGLMMALDDITERKKAEQDLKSAYNRIQDHANRLKSITWKQSHLMRSPLANLKALAALLKDHPSDTESLAYFQTELERLDAIIREMAQDASDHVM